MAEITENISEILLVDTPVEDEVVIGEIQTIAATYIGIDTDNIEMSVDNQNRTISASLIQNQYADTTAFPLVGSDKLIYIDLSNNSLWRYDANNGYVCVGTQYETINNDYNADTNRLATQNDLTVGYGKSLSVNGASVSLLDENGDVLNTIQTQDTGATSVGLRTGDTGNVVTNMTYDASTRKITFEMGETFVKTSDIDSALSTSSTNPVQNKKIAELVPAQASSSNQLADKNFVNSSIATATATFRGTYNVVSDLNLTPSATTSQIATALASEVSTADNNDYCFIQIPTSTSTPTQIARIDRYKYDGTDWGFEYSLNNSGFTSAQWEAINSGITSTLVTKLNGIEAGAEVNDVNSVNGKAGAVVLDADDISDANTTNKFVTDTEKNNWNGKQDVLTAGAGITINGSTIKASGIFLAIYGTTTHTEIDNAIMNGLTPICKRMVSAAYGQEPAYYMIAYNGERSSGSVDYYQFTRAIGTKIETIEVTDSDVWSIETYTLLNNADTFILNGGNSSL